jgi:hypothetical protein
MLRTEALAWYVRDLAVTGLTSDPTILGRPVRQPRAGDGAEDESASTDQDEKITTIRHVPLGGLAS